MHIYRVRLYICLLHALCVFSTWSKKMGRSPCCEKVGLRRGRWTAEEDEKLRSYILANGEGLWKSLPKNAGLLRCGKSCRLRWINYLRSDLKRGKFSAEEDEIIINLHTSMGNRWSVIAGFLPGRTDNEIKNYWNSHLGRRIDSYRKPNPNFAPPLAAGKRTASGSSMKKTKPGKNNSPSNPKPCRIPIPSPHKQEPCSTISCEENVRSETGNASMDSSTPSEDRMDDKILSLDDTLADVDGILPIMEEAKMKTDNRECSDSDDHEFQRVGSNSNNPGCLEINCGEFWHGNYSGGAGWDWDWGSEAWGQEDNMSSPWIRVNSEIDSEKLYGEMVAWIWSQ